MKKLFLLLGIGFPRQEKLIYELLPKNIFKIGIGCGGTIDVLSGTVKRAPDILIKLHIEWSWRLIKQPSRIGRMMVLPKFLREVIENAPFKVLSIQVDGGSEFMKEFEETCRELEIPLYVLPPAKPTYNGKIERSNRTFREEFYHDLKEESIVGTRRELKKFVEKYNSFRPHNSLNGLTPLEYIYKYNSGGSNCLTSV